MVRWIIFNKPGKRYGHITNHFGKYLQFILGFSISEINNNLITNWYNYLGDNNQIRIHSLK